ncbi:MAG: radical SAM family heme chaperone HemW [Bacteroidales bacterium]|jgi:oxygen-independent coproporphyrinogen-3 oxidase|nr:radical SAM family heme chaperone HemW [Bacteroidales bacterium]
MAGIYIHIPFCKKKCHYCDFYKTLDTGMAENFIRALVKEMILQKDYLENKKVKTIYLGGGTPSVLTAAQVREILEKLGAAFDIAEDAEITMEVNPDDISRVYARDLKQAGINRISLGIQSWNNDILAFLNRRHTADEAEQALKDIMASGIDNISVDLIYGIPGLQTGQWKDELQKTVNLDIKHISAYHLTVEEDTMLGKMKKSGNFKEISEEESEKQFNMLIDICRKNAFVQYEISNFCKDEWYSVHNTNYWKQEAYLGLGPSAHSYDGESRQWNVADLQAYLRSIEKDTVPFTVEVLTQKDKYNEYIMTSLRTMWGINIDMVEEKINKESRDYLNNLATRFVKYGMMTRKGNQLMLTDQGRMISDNIISELMMA